MPMECRACALPLKPGQTTCDACGEVNDDIADDDFEGEDLAGAESAADAQTQILPAVGAQKPAPSAHPDDLDTRTVPRIAAPLAWRPSMVNWRPLLIGAATGAAVVLAVLIAVVVAGGGLSGLFAAPGSTPGAHASAPATQASATPVAATEVTDFSCTPRQLSAPGAGRWRLFRTEWGQRGNFDYLRLKLRPDGQHAESAVVNAELLAPADVPGRYGLDAPSDGDIALVIAFDGPVGIGGPWGGRAGYSALRDFRIARAQDGRVHAVVAVRGQGCFRLSGGAWESGDANSPTDVTLEIQKP